jgi:hypothetical protein
VAVKPGEFTEMTIQVNYELLIDWMGYWLFKPNQAIKKFLATQPHKANVHLIAETFKWI